MMIIKEIEQVTLEHLGRRNDWLEPAAFAALQGLFSFLLELARRAIQRRSALARSRPA
jgi:hypothetical protein